jgi:serine/threonine-protein kinase HipA
MSSFPHVKLTFVHGTAIVTLIMDFELHYRGAWHRCATVELVQGSQGSRHAPVRLQYEADYAVAHMGARDHRALTVRAPVNLRTRDLPNWPSFLIDLLPQGAARKRIERVNNAPRSDWALLGLGAVNPVGNLRVRPAEARIQRKHRGFELSDMVSRGDEFVEYAHELGATVAGATDTQGEAPKFWVVEDENGRWHPDNGALGFAVRRYMLLKFPVPEAGTAAAEILRHEALYQRVGQILGLRVTQQLPESVDGALLIPRFDRRFVGGAEVRLGVESLYSIGGVLDSAASSLRHHEVLIALASCVTHFDSELWEYIQRDLLNLALGNRDNHGRNMAVLKNVDGTLELAPIYDFGPSFLDARAIARVIRWEGEDPGSRDWTRIMRNLQTRLEESDIVLSNLPGLVRSMRSFADKLDHLPGLMGECGIASDIIGQRSPEIERLARDLRALKDF